MLLFIITIIIILIYIEISPVISKFKIIINSADISINKFNNFDKLTSIINHQIYRCYICYEEIKLYMKNNNINYDFFRLVFLS